MFKLIVGLKGLLKSAKMKKGSEQQAGITEWKAPNVILPKGSGVSFGRSPHDNQRHENMVNFGTDKYIG